MERTGLLATQVLASAICIVMVGFRKPAGADDAPLSAELSLASNKITLGEPVVLRYKLTNTSNVPVHVVLGKELTHWLAVSVIYSASRPAAAVPGNRLPPVLGGISTGTYRNLAVGASEEGDLIVTGLIAVPAPGRYSVVVRAKVPYRAGEAGVWSSDWSAPLAVGLKNLIKLRRVAEALRKQAKQEKEGRQIYTAVESLFSMPAQAALPVWRALVNEPALSAPARSMAMAQLMRIGSTTAADVLAEVIMNPELSQEERNAATHAHVEIYRAGDPRLREYPGSNVPRTRRPIPKLFTIMKGIKPSEHP